MRPSADTVTITRLLQTDNRFSTLAAVLDSTGLDSVLEKSGPYTLLAPPNSAFQALPEGTMSTLLGEQRDRLRTILALHVLDGRVTSEQLKKNREVTTLQGDTLLVRVDDSTVTVGNGQIVDQDITVTNGLVHVINRVLQPPEDSDDNLGGGAN